MSALCDMALKYLDTQQPKVAAPVDANGLKGCPFCKGTARIAYGWQEGGDYGQDEERYFGECNSCDGRGKSFSVVGRNPRQKDQEEAKKFATEAWNTRPDSREPKAMREAEEVEAKLSYPAVFKYDEIPKGFADLLKEARAKNIEVIRDALQSKGCALPEYTEAGGLIADSWQMVPTLLTARMLDQGLTMMRHAPDAGAGTQKLKQAWHAMLSAAPHPSKD